MNRNLLKLLQSLAGAVILSMASMSMAATYIYEFDGAENERDGQPLIFGDLNVYGGKLNRAARPDPNVRSTYVYLDAGSTAGLGVCKGSIDNGAGGGSPSANKCFTKEGDYAGSDDNMQKNEVCGFVFDVTKKISEVGLHGGDVTGHSDLTDGTKTLIWTDSATGGGFKLLSSLGSQIKMGFELVRIAIFGSMSQFYKDYIADNLKMGTASANNIYVTGINEVPTPVAVWSFGSALLGLTGLRRRKVAV